MIWESIAAFPQAIEVSPELKAELIARLTDFERNPEAGYSWDQVKSQLKSGSWRNAAQPESRSRPLGRDGPDQRRPHAVGAARHAPAAARAAHPAGR